MNYGALGAVAGHEITHGFDDRGSQRDGDGNLVDWWQSETKKKYRAKTKCIVEQYGNYSVEVGGKTLQLNGVTTQGDIQHSHWQSIIGPFRAWKPTILMP